MNLKMTALKITDSAGKPKDTPYTELNWVETDYEKDFGLTDFSGDSFAALTDLIRTDMDKGREFQFKIMGIDMEDTE